MELEDFKKYMIEYFYSLRAGCVKLISDIDKAVDALERYVEIKRKKT